MKIKSILAKNDEVLVCLDGYPDMVFCFNSDSFSTKDELIRLIENKVNEVEAKKARNLSAEEKIRNLGLLSLVDTEIQISKNI